MSAWYENDPRPWWQSAVDHLISAETRGGIHLEHLRIGDRFYIEGFPENVFRVTVILPGPVTTLNDFELLVEY